MSERFRKMKNGQQTYYDECLEKADTFSEKIRDYTKAKPLQIVEVKEEDEEKRKPVKRASVFVA